MVLTDKQKDDLKKLGEKLRRSRRPLGAIPVNLPKGQYDPNLARQMSSRRNPLDLTERSDNTRVAQTDLIRGLEVRSNPNFTPTVKEIGAREKHKAERAKILDKLDLARKNYDFQVKNQSPYADISLAVNIGLNGMSAVNSDDPSVRGFNTANKYLGEYYNDIMTAQKQLTDFDKTNNTKREQAEELEESGLPKLNMPDVKIDTPKYRKSSSILDNIDMLEYDKTGDDSYIRTAVLDNTAKAYLSKDLLNFYNQLDNNEDKAKYLAITASVAMGGRTTWDKEQQDALMYKPAGERDNGNGIIDSFFNGAITGTINGVYNLAETLSLSADKTLGKHRWTRFWTGANQDNQAVDDSLRALIDYAQTVTKQEVKQVEKTLNNTQKNLIISAAKKQAEQSSALYNYYKADTSHFNWTNDDWLDKGVLALVMAKYAQDPTVATKVITDSIQNTIASKWTPGDSVLSGVNLFWDNAAADVLSVASVGEAAYRMGESALYGKPISFSTALYLSTLRKWADGVLTMGGYWNFHPIDNISDLANGTTQVNGKKYTPKSWDDYLGYALGMSQASEMQRQNLESQRNGGAGIWNPDALVYNTEHENEFFNGNLFGSLMDAFGQYGFTAASTLASMGTSTVAKGLTSAVTKNIAKQVEKGTSRTYIRALAHLMEKNGIKAELTDATILGNRQQLVKSMLDGVTDNTRKTLTEAAKKEAYDNLLKSTRMRFIRGLQIATGLVGTGEGALEATNTYDQSMTDFIKQAREIWIQKHSLSPMDDNPNHSLEGRITLDIVNNHQDDIEAKMLLNRSSDVMLSIKKGAYTDEERQLAIQQLVLDRMNEEMSKDLLFQKQILNAHNHAMVAFATNFWANSAINGMLDATLKLSSMSKAARDALNKRKGLYSKLEFVKSDNGIGVLIKNLKDLSKWWEGLNKAGQITKKVLKNAGGEGIEEITQDVTNAASQGFAKSFYTGYLAASYNPDSRDLVNGSIIGTVINGIKGGYLSTALAEGLYQGITELGKQDTWKDGLYGFLGAALGGPSINTKAASSVASAVGKGIKDRSFSSFKQAIGNDLLAERQKEKKDFKDAKGLWNKAASVISSFNNLSPISYRSSVTQAVLEAREDDEILLTIRDNVNNIINTDEALQLLTYLPTQMSFMQALEQQTDSGNEVGSHDTKALIATLNSLVLNAVGGDYASARNGMLTARIGWQNQLVFDGEGNLKTWDLLDDNEKQQVTNSIVNQALNDSLDGTMSTSQTPDEEIAKTLYDQIVAAASTTLLQFRENSDGTPIQMTDKQAIDRMAKSALQQLDFDTRVKELSDKYDNMYGDSPLDFETKAALISGDILFDEWTRRSTDIDLLLNSLKGQVGDSVDQDLYERDRNTIVSLYGSVQAFLNQQDSLAKAIQTQEVLAKNATNDDDKTRALQKLDALRRALSQSRLLRDSIDVLTERQQQASNSVSLITALLDSARSELESIKEEGQAKKEAQKKVSDLEKQLDQAKNTASKQVDRVLSEEEILSLSDKDRAAMIAHRDDKKLYSEEQRRIINNLISKANDILNRNADLFHQDKDAFINKVQDLSSIRDNMNQVSLERSYYLQHIDLLANIGSVLRRKEEQRNILIENQKLLDSNNYSSYKEQEDAINSKIEQYDREDGIAQGSTEHSVRGNILRRLSVGDRKDNLNNGYKQYMRAKLLLRLTIGALTRRKLDFTNPNVLRAIAVLYSLIALSKNEGYSQARQDLYRLLSEGGKINKEALSENILSAIDAILSGHEYTDYLQDSDLIPELARTQEVLDAEKQTLINDTNNALSDDTIDAVKQQIQDILGTGTQELNRELQLQQVKKPVTQSTAKAESKSATQTQDTKANIQTPKLERRQKQEEHRITGDLLEGTHKSINMASLKANYPNEFEYLNNYGFEEFLQSYDPTNKSNGNNPKYHVIKMNIGNNCFTLVVAYDPNQKGSKGLSINGFRYGILSVIDVDKGTDSTINNSNFRLATDNAGRPYSVNLTHIDSINTTNKGKQDLEYSVWHTDRYDPKQPYQESALIHEILYKFIKNLKFNPKFSSIGKGADRFMFLWGNRGVVFELNVKKLRIAGKSLLLYLNDAMNGAILGDEAKLPLISDLLDVLKNNGIQAKNILPDPSDKNIDVAKFLKDLFTYSRQNKSGRISKVPMLFFGGKIATELLSKASLDYHQDGDYWSLRIGDKEFTLHEDTLSLNDMLEIVQALNDNNLLMLDNTQLSNVLRSYISSMDEYGIPTKGIGQSLFTQDDFGLKIIAGYMTVGMIKTTPYENVVQNRNTTVSVVGSGERQQMDSKQTTTSSDNPMDDNHIETPKNRALKVLTEAGKKARELVERIKSDSKKIKLDNPNSPYYEDESGNKFNRVTTIESFIKGILLGKWTGSPFEKQAQGIGNSFDTTMRHVLEYLEDNFTNADGTRRLVTKSDLDSVYKHLAKVLNIPDNLDASDFKTWGNFTENARKAIVMQAMTFYNLCVLNGWHTVTSGISAVGTVKTTSGRDIRVSGTLDILVYDDNGKFRIIDMKTFRHDTIGTPSLLKFQDSLDNNIPKWTTQVNLYKQLLSQRYPNIEWADDALYILPCAVSYNQYDVNTEVSIENERRGNDGEYEPTNQVIGTTVINGRRGKPRKLSLNTQDLSPLSDNPSSIQDLLIPIVSGTSDLIVDEQKVQGEDVMVNEGTGEKHEEASTLDNDLSLSDENLGQPVTETELSFVNQPSEELGQPEQQPEQHLEEKPLEKVQKDDSPLEDFNSTSERQLDDSEEDDDDDEDIATIDDLQVTEQEYSFSKMAGSLLRGRKFTLKKKGTGYSKPMTTRQKKTWIKKYLKSHISDKLNSLFSISGRDILKMLDINIEKLINNPQRFSKLMVQRLIQYYLDICSKEDAEYKAINHEFIQKEYLYAIMHEGMTLEEVENLLALKNILLDLCPLLIQYYQADEAQRGHITESFDKEYKTKDSLTADKNSRIKHLGNYFENIHQKLEFLQDNRSADTLSSMISSITNDLLSSILNSGADNYDDYEISEQALTNKELESINKVSEKILGNTSIGSIHDAIEIVKRLVLAPKGEKPVLDEKHPLYQVLYAIGTALQQTNAPLSIKIESNDNPNIKGLTSLVSTNEFGQTSISLFINNIHDSEELLHTLTHELIHALTKMLIQEDSLFSNDIQSVIGQVKDYLNLQYMDNYNTVSKIYGLSGVDEFVAEFFSNPIFQEMLKQVPYGYDTPTTGFRRVLHLITRKLFGKQIKKQPSVYDQVFPKLQRLMLTSQLLNTVLRGDIKQFQDRLQVVHGFVDYNLGRFSGLALDTLKHILDEMTMDEFNSLPTALQDCVVACKTY